MNYYEMNLTAFQDLKCAGMLSLAGILKRSDTLLVLWDATYAQRLWCLLEFAAFLKSKQINREVPRRGTQNVWHALLEVCVIKPIFIGPTAVLLFLGSIFGLLPMTTAPIDRLMLLPASCIVLLLLLGQYLAVATMRNYFRAVEDMQRALRCLRRWSIWCF